LLQEIPGVDQTLAAAIVAELGNESAGKKKSRRIPKGHVYLKTAVREAANAAARAKATYLREKFFRRKVRHGYEGAAVAAVHKIQI
jgi:transposase